MKIVDSQVHIWYPDTPERPWPLATELKAQRERAFTLEDLLPEMRAAASTARSSCRRPGKDTATIARSRRRGFIPTGSGSWGVFSSTYGEP